MARFIERGNGPKPVGEVFTILTSESISGAFSNVEGLVFDGGRERYQLAYSAGAVTLTVENNTTPEPASAALLLLGGSLFGLAIFRARRRPAV